VEKVHPHKYVRQSWYFVQLTALKIETDRKVLSVVLNTHVHPSIIPRKPDKPLKTILKTNCTQGLLQIDKDVRG